MDKYGYMPGRYPAVVRSYDQQRRTCRVEMPDLTEGGDVLPEAEIEYSIGDKSRLGQYETEIEILPGDTVWISFIGGDSRYPIITGYRNPQAGNSVDWRRWHHENIEFLANVLINALAGSDIRLKAGNDFQVSSDADCLIRAYKDLKTMAFDRTEIRSDGRILIESFDSQIVLRSRTGRVVI